LILHKTTEALDFEKLSLTGEFESHNRANQRSRKSENPRPLTMGDRVVLGEINIRFCGGKNYYGRNDRVLLKVQLSYGIRWNCNRAVILPE
jgi:hypothetical protein